VRAAAVVRRRTPELLAAAQGRARATVIALVVLLRRAYAWARPYASRAVLASRRAARSCREAALSAAGTAAAAWRDRAAAPRPERRDESAAEREPRDTDAPLSREARGPRRLVVSSARPGERVPRAADRDE
jgi:hypothetical protein